MAMETAVQVLDGFADGTWSIHRSLCSVNLGNTLQNLPPAKTPFEPAGHEYYKHLSQAHDGHWPGEYGGSMFFISWLSAQHWTSHHWYHSPINVLELLVA